MVKSVANPFVERRLKHYKASADSTSGGEGPASVLRRKTARQALTDRASRGMSLMSGFKSKQQDKSTTKSQQESMVRTAGVERPPTPPPPPASVINSNSDVGDEEAGESSGVVGGVGVGEGAHLTKLVLKFTTASESDVQPSCEITTEGASIGQSELNTVSIPSDNMLAPLNHAIVMYEGGGSGRGSENMGVSVGSDDASTGGTGTGGDNTPGKVNDGAVGGGVGPRTGGFFFSDGGQGTDFAAALRIRVGEGNRDWPLTQGCHFSAGLTVFRAHRTRPARGGGGTQPDKATDSPTKEDGGAEDGGNEDVDDSVAYQMTATERNTGSTGGEITTESSENTSISTDVRVGEGVSGDDAGASQVRTSRLWLEALAGCLKGQVWEVGPAGATVGRASDNNLSLADKEMSRRHSKIEYDEAQDTFYLCDFGSLNGTYMQMVGPYAPRRRLGLGDHLLVGRTGFSVNRYDYGISERMGARPSMEDRSTVIQDLGLSELEGSLLWPQTFAGVYDGHGGGQASEYLWSNLHLKVSESLAARSERLLAAAAIAERAGAGVGRSPPTKGQGLLARAGLRRKPFGSAGSITGGDGGGTSGGDPGGPWEALDEVVKEAVREAFAAADKEFIATSRLPEAGSTASTCLVLGPRLYIANVGDSRTVLCRSGKLRMASQDHKPCRADEQARVHKAGGFVAHRRVMGELAVSRAFGDSEFKGKQATTDSWGVSGTDGRNDLSEEEVEETVMQLITAEPEFLMSEITTQDNFVVLACDGIFDVLTSEEVVGNVIEKMKIHGDAQRCCEDLTEKAIVERRTRDNVSLVLLIFNRWY